MSKTTVASAIQEIYDTCQLANNPYGVELTDAWALAGYQNLPGAIKQVLINLTEGVDYIKGDVIAPANALTNEKAIYAYRIRWDAFVLLCGVAQTLAGKQARATAAVLDREGVRRMRADAIKLQNPAYPKAKATPPIAKDGPIPDGCFAALEALAGSNDGFPVDFDDAWKWIGYSRKDNALVALKAELDLDVEYMLLNIQEQDVPLTFSDFQRSHPTKYMLSIEGFKIFCQAAGTTQGKKVRRQYIQIEKAYLALKAEKSQEIYPAMLDARIFQRDTIEPWADGHVEAFGWLLKLLEVNQAAAPMRMGPARIEYRNKIEYVDRTEYLKEVEIQIKETVVDSPQAAWYREQWQSLLDVASEQALNLNRMGLTLNKYIKMVDQLQDEALTKRPVLEPSGDLDLLYDTIEMLAEQVRKRAEGIKDACDFAEQAAKSVAVIRTERDKLKTESADYWVEMEKISTELANCRRGINPSGPLTGTNPFALPPGV
jgi:hypothetical protein